MNVERITEEYLKNKDLLDALGKRVDEYKKLLSKAIDEQGEPDEKGHKWLQAGKYMLKRQKSQPEKKLNHDRAEDWARERNIWPEVRKVLEVLDEDAILGWVWDHKNDPGVEQEFATLYDTPQPTWSFIRPVEEEQYDL